MSFVKADTTARRHELTDAQWSKIQHLLPGKKSDPGRTAADNRLFVNAVVYVLKTGIPWADLPAASANTTRYANALTAGAGVHNARPHMMDMVALAKLRLRSWRRTRRWRQRQSCRVEMIGRTNGTSTAGSTLGSTRRAMRRSSPL